MKYSELSDRIKSAIEKVENIATEEIAGNSVFHPFLFYKGKVNNLRRLMVDSIDEAIDLTEELIQDIEEDIDIVILTFKDKIELNDGIFDAIIYQIYDTDEDNGYSYGQIYEIKDGKIVFFNKKIFLGNIRNLLIF